MESTVLAIKRIRKPRRAAVALNMSHASLRDVDSPIPAPTLDELTESFKEEAKLLNQSDLNRIGKQLFDRWMMQAERIWIATNLHGVAVKAFVEMTETNRSIAFDLVRLWNNRADIIHVAELEGRYYYWRDMLYTHLGKPPKIRDTIRDQRKRIEEQDAELTKLRKRAFSGRGRKGEGHRGSENRPTPRYIFDYLNAIHDFDWDCCASKTNTKVPGRFFSVLNDALKREWRFRCGFCNPPYHAQAMRDFLEKAREELRLGHCRKVVFLLPAWTDAAAWFHAHAAHGHIQFLAGRIAFMNGDSQETMDDAKWGVMVVTLTEDSMLNGKLLSASLLHIPKPAKARKLIAKPTPEKHPTAIESSSLTVTPLSGPASDPIPPPASRSAVSPQTTSSDANADERPASQDGLGTLGNVGG